MKNVTPSKFELMKQGFTANQAEMIVQKRALMEEDLLSEEVAERIVQKWLADNNAKWGIA